MRPVVASVPYLNAKPLIYRLAEDDGVELVFEVPSKLPAMIDTGQAAVAMASSFDAIRTPGRKAVAGVSISTMAQVESVRLFSKVPLKRIRTLALDQSSLTSNHLALILLAELYGVEPKTRTLPPEIDGMLGECDACVLIGDKGLTARHSEAIVLDLGSAWSELTGMPFVWALWIGGPQLDRALADKLRDARAWGIANMERVIPWASKETGFPIERCANYLTQTMDYDLTKSHLAGLGAYAEFLKKLGHVPRPEPLVLV